MMRMPFASTVSFKNSFTLSVTSEIIKRLLNVYLLLRGVLSETPLLHLITFSIVCVPNWSLSTLKSITFSTEYTQNTYRESCPRAYFWRAVYWQHTPGNSGCFLSGR